MNAPLDRRMSPDQARNTRFTRSPLTRRGLDEEEVYGFTHRLAAELGERDAEITKLIDENRRVKQAMRDWQSQRVNESDAAEPLRSDDRAAAGQPAPGAPLNQLTPAQATAESAALMARAQQQIDAQVAQAELYCRQREQEAARRYDEIVHEARRQAKADAEAVAHQYRSASGSQYSSDQEQVQRQQVYLTALLHALDALATHVHATRHAFTVEFQKMGGQLEGNPDSRGATDADPSTD